MSKETAKKTIKQGYVLLSSMIAFFLRSLFGFGMLRRDGKKDISV